MLQIKDLLFLQLISVYYNLLLKYNFVFVVSYCKYTNYF